MKKIIGLLLIVVMVAVCVTSAFALRLLEMSDTGSQWNKAEEGAKVAISGVISLKQGKDSSFWLQALDNYYSYPRNVGDTIGAAVYAIKQVHHLD